MHGVFNLSCKKGHHIMGSRADTCISRVVEPSSCSSVLEAATNSVSLLVFEDQEIPIRSMFD